MSGTGIKLEPQISAGPDAKLHVLLVEDNALDAALVVRELCKGGFDITADVVQDEAAFTQALRTHLPEVVLADYNLPSWKGMETLNVLRREGLDIPMILVSGALGDVTAVECIRQGATDYVLKDGLARLAEVIRRALREKNERTLRHQVEKDLAQKIDELARSNADLEQFAYVASHDLQEPLRMVAAYTQLLARTLSRPARRERRQIHRLCQRRSCAHAGPHSRICWHFREWAGMAVPGERIECNAVMERCAADPGPRHPGEWRGRHLWKLPAVWADRTQMSQVFQNLIGNASSSGGADPPVISIQAEKADEHWLFSVSDNGIGIAPEHAESIFVVFQRLHARTEYPGNGIGLAICKKIVERSGGRIWVESQAGSGSTFKFTMPIPDSKEDDSDHVPAEMGRQGAKA